jgi:hypothetical protein
MGPALLRHASAYAELLIAETGDALRQWRRRAVGAAVAAGAAMMALALGCVWIIAANWDGPNRLNVVAGLCAAFVLIAFVGVIYARGGRVAGQPLPFERLAKEWQADLQEITSLERNLDLSEVPAPPRREAHGG